MNAEGKFSTKYIVCPSKNRLQSPNKESWTSCCTSCAYYKISCEIDEFCSDKSCVACKALGASKRHHITSGIFVALSRLHALKGALCTSYPPTKRKLFKCKPVLAASRDRRIVLHLANTCQTSGCRFKGSFSTAGSLKGRCQNCQRIAEPKKVIENIIFSKCLSGQTESEGQVQIWKPWWRDYLHYRSWWRLKWCPRVVSEQISCFMNEISLL